MMNRRMQTLLSNGEIGAPCGVPAHPVPAALAALPVVLYHGHFQPSLDPPQQVPVAHATRHRPQQFRVWNLPEVIRQVPVHDLPVHALNLVQRAARLDRHTASAALQAIAGRGRAMSAPAWAAEPYMRPCRKPDPSSTYIE